MTKESNQKEARIAAFFDFDKTIIAVDSAGKEATTVLAKLYQHHFLVLAGLILCTLINPLVEKNWVNTETLNLVYYFCCYRNFPVIELQAHAHDLYQRLLKPAVYQEILEKLQEHQKKGHLVVLLSATSEHLIQPFAKEYNVDVCIATKIKTNATNDCYTGVVDGKVCCQATKAEHIQRLAQEYNLDLNKSYAYSDHHHDIPLLESVGNASVVHPTPILEVEAKKREWPILRPAIPDIVAAARSNGNKSKDQVPQSDSIPSAVILFGVGVAIVLVGAPTLIWKFVSSQS
ncbi:MAG: hypothetical protein SGBAC_012782 [Bacillariaceae sp.]